MLKLMINKGAKLWVKNKMPSCPNLKLETHELRKMPKLILLLAFHGLDHI